MRTDTERLDFLEWMNRQARYTGKAVLRWSETGRGWRLHETGDPSDGASATVRDAIDKFIDEVGSNS